MSQVRHSYSRLIGPNCQYFLSSLGRPQGMGLPLFCLDYYFEVKCVLPFNLSWGERSLLALECVLLRRIEQSCVFLFNSYDFLWCSVLFSGPRPPMWRTCCVRSCRHRRCRRRFWRPRRSWSLARARPWLGKRLSRNCSCRYDQYPSLELGLNFKL